jgi:hypothetical protein
MSNPLPPFWQLAAFAERLDIGGAEQKASDELIRTVAAGIFTRYDDPYRDVRRDTGSPNYWWGPIPDTEHERYVVCCFYSIIETERRVRCDTFATLALPV